MIVRRAKKEDIPRIMHLLRQVCLVHHNGRPDLFYESTKYNESDLESLLSDDLHPIFVAVDENDMAWGHGFCEIREYKNSRLIPDHITLYIDDICVDEAARRQHIGRMIYDAIVAYAKEIGAYNVTLNVWTLNVGAQKFYESCGLKPLSTTLEAILTE